jgi:hypothetical protein
LAEREKHLVASAGGHRQDPGNPALSGRRPRCIVGERGIRVVRTGDGLLTSGVLVPPYLFDASFDPAPCSEDVAITAEITEAMTDVAVTDRGNVTISCGAARFSWAPRADAGDVRQRILALLAAPPARPVR